MNNDCDTVALLLNHGDVNVNAMAIQIPIEYEFDKRVYKNVYPIHMACHFGSPRLFSYLVRQDDIKIKVHDDCDRSILHYAFKNCNYEVYKNVLKFRGFNCKQDKCAYDGYPIHIVCQVNNIQGAHFLLSQPLIELDDTVDDRRNKKDYGKTPLLLASCRGYGEITKAILDHGRCDINARIEATGETTFLNCCYYGLDEVIDTLMRKKAFTMKRQIFSNAADSGSLNSVKLIIEYGGFNVNAAEKELKRTALMLAAKKGYSEIVDELLKIPDIDVNKSDISGMTALHFACRKGDTASVELLLKMPDIDVNVQSVFTYGFYRVLYYCAYHVF